MKSVNCQQKRPTVMEQNPLNNNQSKDGVETTNQKVLREISPVQDEMKAFKQKMFVLMIFFVLLISVVVFIELHINKTAQSADTSAQQTEQTEGSEFKSILASIIKDLSTDNKQYALDERYYNENDVLTYLGIITGHDAKSITKEEVQRLFWNIFIPINNNGIVELVKKDNEALIMECIDKTKMNMLDYAFMGTTNDEIIKASKGAYISQNDDKFEKIPYGTSNVKSSGCGPISLTMAINYVSEANVVSLDEVLKWAEENNMYEKNAGTKWSLVRNFPNTVSVNCKEMYIASYEKFKNSLSEGEVYVTTMNVGHFTDNGHFIVITEIKDDEVYVLDSASICRSLKKWDAKLVFDESKKYFWKISKRKSE